MPLDSIAQRRLLRAATAFAFACGLIFLWTLCSRKPDINFLSSHSGADWIIYPKPPDAMTYRDFEISAVFRRSFQLDGAPRMATLRLRAFKRYDISINGNPVTNSSASASNWKDAAQLDVAKFLHAGTNEIAITVFNNKAQPALWALLETERVRIATGPEWQSSLLGAAWRPACAASSPNHLAPGNQLFSTENTFASLRQSIPMLCVFALIACGIVYGSFRYLRRFQQTGVEDRANGWRTFMTRMVLLLAICWAALFFNNLGWLPREIGYDENAHEDYINFIYEQKSLPLANQGWEMCQPPLYYMTGACLLSASGAPPASQRGAWVLRLIGLATGIAHLIMIYLCLRLLFPDCLGAQWFGVLLAAFLPENLYISQYITNEFLAAAFVTAALYGCLRLIKTENETWRLALAIGLCVGAALLTKFTPILSVPFLAAVFARRMLANPRAEFPRSFRLLLIFFVAIMAVAGWHYARVWIHFGKPVVHDWDPISGYSWWTDKGFQTPPHFLRFGESLVRPYYSVINSFADGIYSSMWGDAGLGGMASWENRPPWNYQLMTAGFLLALFPTAIIVAGFVICAVKFLRRPEPVWFLLLGVAVTTYAALFYMSLELPYYCNAKSFYALMSLLPICAFAGAGWQAIINLAGKFRPVLYVLMLVWAMNVYASFWISGGASATHVCRASWLSTEGRTDEAMAELTEALRIDPHDLLARRFLAGSLVSKGDIDGAWQQTQRILADDPNDRNGLMQSALVLVGSTDGMPRALELAKRAAEVAPDDMRAWRLLSQCQEQLGDLKDAVAASRETLRISPFKAQLHFILAAQLEKLGEKKEAQEQQRIAQALQPPVTSKTNPPQR